MKADDTAQPSPSPAPRRSYPTIEELAAQQGVKPIERIEDMAGDFWPEEETVEEFLAWLDEERGRTRLDDERNRTKSNGASDE